MTHTAQLRAAVLADNDKVWVGEEPIEDMEHLTHDGDECDPLGFSVGDQASKELAQDGVVSDGGDGGHVENVAHDAASAAHMAGSMAEATVACKGGDANQS